MVPFVQPTSSERRSWRALGRSVLTERLGLKATALVIAVLLWIVIGARQPTESYVSVLVIPALDSSLVLLGDPPQVRARVAGRAANLVKLQATPPVVRRTIDGDVPDTLVLDLVPDDVHFPTEMAGDVRVVGLEPRSVTLRFATRASRRVEVRSDLRVLVKRDSVVVPHYSVRFEPETVRITGPRGAVRSVHMVRPIPLTITAGDTLPHLVDIDTAGLGVRVHPAQVKVVARVECPAGSICGTR
jgi:hypothetical protein